MPVRILIVDDSSVIREHVRTTLQGPEWELVEATNGIEALQRIDETSNLRMCICDVQMPVMDGMEMLAQLRKRGNSLPVLMLTTAGSSEQVKQGRELQAAGWIVKPFEPEALLQAVRSIVES